jgi:hypothetical protein
MHVYFESSLLQISAIYFNLFFIPTAFENN